MAKIGTNLFAHLMFSCYRNVIEKADDIQTYSLPLVEATSSQEQYYIRSPWHLEECNWEGTLQSDVPLGRGIWWPRAVLHQVSMTFWRDAFEKIEKPADSQRYPPVEASSGQEQYYIRSSWHLEECNWEGTLQSDVPLDRGIWWPRAVLHQVILTFGYPLGQADIQSDVLFGIH